MFRIVVPAVRAHRVLQGGAQVPKLRAGSLSQVHKQDLKDNCELLDGWLQKEPNVLCKYIARSRSCCAEHFESAMEAKHGIACTAGETKWSGGKGTVRVRLGLSG